MQLLLGCAYKKYGSFLHLIKLYPAKSDYRPFSYFQCQRQTNFDIYNGQYETYLYRHMLPTIWQAYVTFVSFNFEM